MADENWVLHCSCMQFLLFVSTAEVKLHIPANKVKEKKKSHSISCFTGQRRYVVHYSFLPQILHLKSPFHQLRGATAAEGWYLTRSLRPVTLGTGVQLMRIQLGEGGPLHLLKRLWRKAGAITLPPWVFFTEEDSYCHNIPASSRSAPRLGEKWLALPVAGSLVEGKFQLLKRAAFRNYVVHFRRQHLLKSNIKAKGTLYFSQIVPS